MKMVENMIGKYVIVRSYGAGVFAGVLVEKEGTEVVLANCRRLWYWSGAASISQLAVDGTKRPDGCKFTKTVDEIYISGVLEIIPTTEQAEKSIKDVNVWQI